MGLDVYPVVGKFREPNPWLPRMTSVNPLRWVDLKPEMLELLMTDGYVEKELRNMTAFISSGNKELFSWLADTYKGETKPLLGKHGCWDRQTWTNYFVDWIDDLTEKKEARTYFLHDYRTFYTIDELMAVDYDVVALMKFDEHYCPHSEKKTYRELFEDSGYFEFLQEAKEKGWEFIVFQFS